MSNTPMDGKVTINTQGERTRIRTVDSTTLATTGAPTNGDANGVVNVTGAAFVGTVSLPAGAGVSPGYVVRIVNQTVANLTVNATVPDTLLGGANVIAANATRAFMCISVASTLGSPATWIAY